MLDIGWSELLLIAIVLVVVVGPKDLPKMLRAFGKATSRMRSTANDFRRQFDEALKEAELEDVKNIVNEARKLDPRSKLTQVFDPIRSAGEDLRQGLQSTSSMSPAEPSKVAEVTTPVEPDGAPVPVAAPATQTTEVAKPVAKPGAARTKSSSKPVNAEAVQPAVVNTPVKAPTKPKAPKPAAVKKAAVIKPVTAKAPVTAKKTTKKTTEETGTKA